MTYRDFADYHTADWRSGQMPKVKPGQTVVSDGDGRHRAYDIEAADEAEFVQWVAQTIPYDADAHGDEPRADDESAADYLARIFVSIHREPI